jgi:hypothetical protein
VTKFGRRREDQYHLIQIWSRVLEADGYSPQWRQASSDNGSKAEPSPNNLTDILEAGMWLQRAVAENWKEAQYLADFLSKVANLEDKTDLYEDSERDRVAAAYLLWPFHAARY